MEIALGADHAGFALKESIKGELQRLGHAVHDLGAGRFILNTLHIRDQLGQHPAAERLLRNMLRFAARDLGQPPADLPAGFDDQLARWGYAG